MTDSTTNDRTPGFTLVRTLDATPDAIFSAWTDADEIAEWWHPAGATTPRDSVEVDLTVGGAYRYTMVDGESGTQVHTGGVYIEIEPVSRLVFTWGEPGAEPDDSPLITLTIESLGDLTRLTFDIRGVEGSKGDAFFYDGWESALDELVSHLGQTAVHG